MLNGEQLAATIFLPKARMPPHLATVFKSSKKKAEN
jgi:hypothetical protein